MCPFGRGDLGPHLTQCGQGQAYLHAKFHLDPSNRLATIHQRYSQTGQTDRTGQTDKGPIAQGEPFYARRPTVWTETWEPTTYQRPMTIFWSHAHHQRHVTICLIKFAVGEWNVAIRYRFCVWLCYMNIIIVANTTWWTLTNVLQMVTQKVTN